MVSQAHPERAWKTPLRSALTGRWTWPAFTVVGVSIAFAAAFGPAGHLTQSLQWVVSLGVIAAVCLGVWANRPSPRLPWALFAAGATLVGIGAMAFSSGQLVGVTLPWSNVNPLDLIGLVLLSAAFAIFGSTGYGSQRTVRMSYVDASVVLVGSAVLLWFTLLHTILGRAGMSTTTRALSIIYPLADLVLIALAVRLAATRAFQLPVYRLLTAGIALGSVANLLWWGFPDDDFTVISSASYFSCFVLLGAAALHPTMGSLAVLATPSATDGISLRRIAVLAASSLSLPVAVVIGAHRHWDLDDIYVLAVASAVIPALVIYRLSDLVAVANGLSDKALRASARAATLIEASPLPTAVVDPLGVVEFWNAAAERTSGWAGSEVIGGRIPMVAAEGEQRVDGLRRRALAGERLDGEEMRLANKAGSARDVRIWTAPVESRGAIDAVVAVFADVTLERRREQEIRYLADHDHLTGVFNRRGFHDRLSAILMQATAATAPALAIIDIDDFKLINDVYGHGTGDRVLTNLAGALSKDLRQGDLIARLSGDEFAVILTASSAAEIAGVAERLLETARDFRLEASEATIDITVSIGLCRLVPNTSIKQALARADAALYEAKRQGRNRVMTWNVSRMGGAERAAARHWSVRIKDALKEDRLLMYLQPIVDLETGEVASYEALARLNDPEGTIVYPGSFLPYAERLGLMPAIDRAIAGQALRLLEEQPLLKVFINLDASSFENDELLELIEQTLLRTPGLRGRLGIEITEHTSVRDIARTRRQLEIFRSLGCTISLDDFGTGFSSFSLLRELPVDLIKIGNGLVRDIDDVESVAVVVHAIVTAAQALGARVVAEDVESVEAGKVLREQGVAYGQGFFFGTPELGREALARTVASLDAAAGEPQPAHTVEPHWGYVGSAVPGLIASPGPGAPRH